MPCLGSYESRLARSTRMPDLWLDYLDYKLRMKISVRYAIVDNTELALRNWNNP